MQNRSKTVAQNDHLNLNDESDRGDNSSNRSRAKITVSYGKNTHRLCEMMMVFTT